MTFTRYNIGKPMCTKDGKLIVIGPYTGSYGHFFCHYLPFVSKFRTENPNAVIVASADHVFYHYLSQYCDYFYGFKHNWSIVLAPGSVKEETEDLSGYLQQVTDELGDEPDVYVDTFKDGIPLHNLYITAEDEYLKLFRQMGPTPHSNVIVLWQRFKRAATERNGSAEHWKLTAEHLLSKGFHVVSAGVPEADIDVPGVESYNHFDSDSERGMRTNWLLQNARCVLFDQSGVFNEVLFAGTPGLIFNCDPGHIKKIPHRNIFKTHLSFYTPKPWAHWQKNPLNDGDLSYMPEWLEEVNQFIKKCETEPQYQYDKANHAGVFVTLES